MLVLVNHVQSTSYPYFRDPTVPTIPQEGSTGDKQAVGYERNQPPSNNFYFHRFFAQDINLSENR